MRKHLDHIPYISAICLGHNVHNAVLSPGSRCAPLTMSFVRQEGMQAYSIPDERSAGFIALGMAQQSQKASVLICTSGTAGLNYSPAVAEAYYQEVPLLILTADRPAEWIDQWDGQTIRQVGMYGEHVKASFNLPEDCSTLENLGTAKSIIHKALEIAHRLPMGPVHINVPIAEPFYPAKGETWESIQAIPEVKSKIESNDVLPVDLIKRINSSDRILILAGQHKSSAKLNSLFHQLVKFPQVSIISDIISNFQDVENAILSQDVFLARISDSDKELLKPDLMISFGKSVISKNLKIYIRNNKPNEHWYVGIRENTPDPFDCLSQSINYNEVHFFKDLLEILEPKNSNYQSDWKNIDLKARKGLAHFAKNLPFTEWAALWKCLPFLPPHSTLHLANSMAVRYINFFSFLLAGKSIEVVANRGTSGIDGSNSSAVGFALKDNKINTLITGDMAFLYDKNAFWHNYSIPNLRIIVINNAGGGIFRLIDGPSSLPELDDWFETKQKHTAESTAKEFGMIYHNCTNFDELTNCLKHFYEPSNQAKLLEVQTDRFANQEVFNSFKTYMNKLYGK
ncbi:2-succinyl-5-enolpyruvyl-6-hydroxy-3-cyclohexene-1-carboxylic-acid synthase [Fulvivirgaceae bacterium LMO-SS25]